MIKLDLSGDNKIQYEEQWDVNKYVTKSTFV